ncbi:MFS transporter [Frondihabitans cladoniiphilus]|uniref:MFS transporter n=1 Tax=Frondihabitans cladoniiphilus TaxID=715785 RepID=A0ABP8W7B0_9MICO
MNDTTSIPVSSPVHPPLIAPTGATGATGGREPGENDRGMSDRRGWLGVLSVALGSFVLVLSEFLPIGLLPAIASDLRVDIGTAGLMVVATGLMGALAAPMVTVLASRIDRRYVLWGLTVLLVVADVLGAFAPNFGVLIVARLLLGIGIGGFWSIGAGIAPRLVHAGAVIKATSFITAGVSVATVVSLPLGALVSSLATWRVGFLIGAALGVVALVGQLFLLPSIPALNRVRFATLGGLFRIPRARVGLIATALIFVGQFTAYTYVSPYLENLAKVSSGTITIALLVFGVAGIVGNFATGVGISRDIVRTMIAAKILLAVAVILLPLLAQSLVGVFVLLIVWGFVWGGIPLGMQTWMGTAAAGGSEGGLALFVTTIQLSLAAGSVVGGLAVSGLGLPFDFFLAGGIAVLGAVVLLTMGSGRSRRAAVSAAAA